MDEDDFYSYYEQDDLEELGQQESWEHSCGEREEDTDFDNLDGDFEECDT